MSRPVIIQIFLRGGQDGLTWCAPAADSLYQSTRGALAVSRNASGNLDNYFTLPPAAYPLKPLFQSGKLAFVHGAGLLMSGAKDRSHFSTQYKHETAGLNGELSTGWLGRGISRFGAPDDSPLRGLAHSTFLPRVLSPGGVASDDPAHYDLPAVDPTDPGSMRIKSALSTMFAATAEPLSSAAISSLDAVGLLHSVTWTTSTATGLAKALQDIGDIMVADIGTVAFNVDFGSWDLHVNLGPFDGSMAALMTTLTNALVAFHDRFAAMMNPPNYVLLCMTEFGRRLVPNNSSGLDHGWGSCITVMSNMGLNGGQVHIRGWGAQPHIRPVVPNLAAQIDADNDLIATIDYRQIVAEAFVERLAVATAEIPLAFPGLVYSPLNVFVPA